MSHWCFLYEMTGHGHSWLRIATVQTDPEPIPPIANPCCNQPIVSDSRP